MGYISEKRFLRRRLCSEFLSKQNIKNVNINFSDNKSKRLSFSIQTVFPQPKVSKETLLN